MKKTILPVMAALSLLCITPAMAVPAFSTKPVISTDVLTVGANMGAASSRATRIGTSTTRANTSTATGTGLTVTAIGR